ncbi:MAG: tetratricopeptide (TPR) repeat protein [Gammaproteobacteria bacterium]
MCDLLKEQKTVTLHTVESREKQLTLQRPLEQITFPESVQAVIRTRLDRLGPEQKEVLRLASVIGREFSLRVLEQIITDKEMLPSSLEKLKLQDLIRQLQRLPEVINQFNHVITQEVTYETLLIKQRVSLHRLVAEAIELIYSERLEEQVEVLAYHYRNSNHVEKTIQYLELAGDKSSGFFSLADARGFYQEAIELIDRFELTSSRKEKRIDLNIKLASVSGYAPSAWNLNCLKTSLDYAEQLNDLSRKVKIKYWLGRVYFSFGNYTEAKHQLESCIEVSDILDEQEVSVLAQNLIGRICWFGGDYQNGIIHLEKWIPLLERFNNPTDANYSLGFLGGMYGLTGNFTKSTEILEKAINQTIELKDINREAVTTWYQALIMAIQGNWQKSIEFCDQAIRLSVSQISNTLIKAGSLLIKGDCLFMLGEVDEGLELMQEGVQIMESIGSSLAMSYFYAWYAEKMSKVGRLQESEELVKKSLELDRFGERWGTPLAYRALASIYLQTDDFPKASSALAQSIQTAIDRGARPDLAIARYHNAQLFLKREDILQAQEQLTQAIELFREMGMTWWLDLARQLEAILVESSNGDESSLDSSVIYD